MDKLTKLQMEQAVKVEAMILDIRFPTWGDRLQDKKHLIDMESANKCIAGLLGWPECVQYSDRDETRIAFCVDHRTGAEEHKTIKQLWLDELEKRDGNIEEVYY